MRKVIRRSIRRQGDGVNVVGEIQGVVAANVGKKRTIKATSRRSRVRVVQRGDHVEVSHEDGVDTESPDG